MTQTHTQKSHQVLSGPEDAPVLVLAAIEPSSLPRSSLVVLLMLLFVIQEASFSRAMISRSASDKTRHMASEESNADRFR